MQLIYLSPVPWSSFAQRPQKFAEWFHTSTGNNVLWIDPYPTRFPVLSDWRRLTSSVSTGSHETYPWLKVIKPRALPIEPLAISGWINRLFWKPVFQMVETYMHQPTMFVIGKPSILALALLEQFKPQRSVYDAMDDFPAFHTGFSHRSMARIERLIIQQTTGMMTSSSMLKARWMPVRQDIKLVLNGLDIEVLPQIQTKPLNKNRILGYVGTIASWFDWDWLISVAQSCPEDTIRLIGPIFTLGPENLPQNIQLLPACDHRTALKAMQEFDVGLIPFKRNVLTESVDPIKYYEYKALGKPVLSTSFGEMTARDNEPGVFLANSKVELQDALNALTAHPYHPTPEDIEQFRQFNSWQARFNASNILSD